VCTLQSLTYDPTVMSAINIRTQLLTHCTARYITLIEASISKSETNTTDAITYTEPPKIDLAAIQKDIERSLREDFQQLINTELGPLHQEYRDLHTELCQQYDQMAKMVDLLHKQNAQILTSLHQMNKPTLAIAGDGSN